MKSPTLAIVFACFALASCAHPDPTSEHPPTYANRDLVRLEDGLTRTLKEDENCPGELKGSSHKSPAWSPDMVELAKALERRLKNAYGDPTLADLIDKYDRQVTSLHRVAKANGGSVEIIFSPTCERDGKATRMRMTTLFRRLGPGEGPKVFEIHWMDTGIPGALAWTWEAKFH